MPTTIQTQTAQQPARKKRRSRGPDWDTFYKNGLPQEIIVIDDTPEPDAGRSDAGVKVVPTGAATNGVSSSRHVAKKRKRDDESLHFDPLYHNKYAGSHHTTPSGSTISTDRTTSSAHNTTAATSLSSNGYHEDAQAGQKRKRTRHQIAQEAKKRDIEVLTDTCPSYRPPPYPPKKAGEVHVRVIPDNTSSKNLKVDDDDGHYIVVPDAELTDRCEDPHSHMNDLG